ncbi:MAG TPA: iron-containing alcohol dehydrogenase [Accumulibacter sp.]|nr:iron-containing alcohol dehydrogenase [Accumulibacter sp.]HMW16542.1 iron-containing alcohol dehydrogenase [Accumulibacter sp.]HMX21354.1 iron-containing alcohol dehydrogenase [Accumulibacter sp.]HMY07768.1 iron-containing alcohol dehydrogenase [Accumulibacter sp.]HNC18125.1 iron-containing alcohol dehydrogenase [Accumulibacter sp.]
MLNFTFHNPTKIVFGANTIERIDDLLPADARVLILLGGGSARRNGTLDEVRAALGNRVVQEFSGIEANPTYETLMRAVEQVRHEKLDFLLGVGGGSVIDGSKFVAAAVPFEGDPWQILLSHGAEVQRALPLASVLTLPATGSEMNCGSVITRHETRSKLAFLSPQVYPVFSILDPTKTYTLPARQIANGIVDAYVHITEQYLTYPVHGRVQDRFAEGLLQTLIEIGPRCLTETENYELRANLMWVTTVALNGLIGAGVPHDWATHMLGHEITALHEIDHARTLAIVLPSMLQVRRQQKREKLLQYADRVWRLGESDEEQRIDQAIRRTADFFERLGVPTRFSAYGLGAETIEPLVGQLIANGMTELGEHRDITPEISRQVYQGAL